MARKVLIVVMLMLVLTVLPAVALAGEEIPIAWDRDPSGGGRAVGRADAPLAVWEALEVEASGPYTVCVRTVYGETLADVRGGGPGRIALRGSDPLVIRYDGPPARMRLLARERRMAVAGTAPGGLARYETEGAVVPAGTPYRSDPVSLRPGSGLKARMVCAVWGGADLQVVFRDAATGAELGRADLAAGRPCGLVYGRVNRPYMLEVVPLGGPAQVYDLEVR